MAHLNFLLQSLCIAVGLAMALLFLSFAGRTGRREPLFIALALLLHVARTVVFTFANYDRLTELGFLPADFELRHFSGFMYILLVSLSAWFLVRALDRLGPGFGRAGTACSLGFAVFYLVDLACIAALMAGADFGLGPRAIETVFYAMPLVVAKLSVMGAILPARFSAAHARAGSPPSRGMVAGLLLLAFSQAMDIAIRFATVLEPVSLGLFYGSYLGGAGLLLSRLSQEAGERSRRGAVLAAASARDDLASSLGLADRERRLLASVLEGKSNKEIAYAEGIGLSAVKHRLYELYRKAGVQSRFELMARARGDSP